MTLTYAPHQSAMGGVFVSGEWDGFSSTPLKMQDRGDGVYTARRFLARRLQVELVTLSACQTGISRSLGGDEISGLSMALLTAGARSLLLGLWSVSAVTTAVMMVDFYDRRYTIGFSERERQDLVNFLGAL